MNANQNQKVDNGKCVALARRLSRRWRADGTSFSHRLLCLSLAAAALVAMQQHQKNDTVLKLLCLLETTQNLKEAKGILKSIKTLVKQDTHKKFFRNFSNNCGTAEETSAQNERIHKRRLVMLALAAKKAIKRLLHKLTLEQAKALYPKVKSGLPDTFIWPVLSAAAVVVANGSGQDVSDISP